MNLLFRNDHRKQFAFDHVECTCTIQRERIEKWNFSWSDVIETVIFLSVS